MDNVLESKSTEMKRYLFAALGIIFVAIGAVGVWLPLIPTVGPLLLASYFFAKSFPALEQRLIRIPIFAQFHGYLDGTKVMSIRERWITIATMWLSIGISGVVIWFSGAPHFVLLILLTLGLIGTWFIWRFRRAG